MAPSRRIFLIGAMDKPLLVIPGSLKLREIMRNLEK
jgi:hypothetical protein